MNFNQLTAVEDYQTVRMVFFKTADFKPQIKTGNQPYDWL